MQTRRTRTHTLSLHFETLECRKLLTSTAHLVKDINSSTPTFGSIPRQIAQIGLSTYFVASTVEHGGELWKVGSSNPFAAVTLVKDIRPGPATSIAVAATSDASEFTNVNGILYFSANDGTHGFELWRSDGTEAGTTLVGDLSPGTNGSYPKHLTNVGGTLFFAASDSSHGIELWKYTGGITAPARVSDIAIGTADSSPQELMNFGGQLYFTADDGTTGREMWKSNGLNSGTVRVFDLFTGTGNGSPTYLTNVSGTLYFAASNGAGRELFKYVGGGATASLVRDIHLGRFGSNPTELTNVDGTLFFAADDGNSGVELWRSSTSSLGAIRVDDIRSGASSSSPRNLTNVNSTLFFSANDGTVGEELWKSTGSTPSLVRNISTGNLGSAFSQFRQFQNKLYFVAKENNQVPRVWVSDGTSPGTHVLSSVPESPDWLIVGRDVIYFQAATPTAGVELWKTDGTGIGTAMVADIQTGTQSSAPPLAAMVNVSGTLFFSARDATSVGLWKSDGTSAGTVKVYGNQIGFMDELTNVNGTLFFTASTPDAGLELWKSDGTTAGTMMVKDTRPGPLPELGKRELTNVNGTLFFRGNDGAHGYELWKSDGTSNGTQPVADILTGAESSDVNQLVNVNGTLYFRANDGTHGVELWKYTGIGSPSIVADIYPSSTSSLPRELTNVAGTLYFLADDDQNGTDLWKTNGNPAGTLLVHDFGDAPNVATLLTSVGNILYFESAKQLWKAQGTSANIVAPTQLSITAMSNVNGRLFFAANDNLERNAVWTTDGTQAGTVPVTVPRYDSYGHSHLANFQGTLFFSGPSTQFELWQSDGSVAGTERVDVEGVAVLASNLTQVGDRLFFYAGNNAVDQELWVVNRELPGDLNGDLTIDAADASVMFGNWGGFGLGDLNADRIVDAADAGILFSFWTGDGGPNAMQMPLPRATTVKTTHSSSFTRHDDRVWNSNDKWWDSYEGDNVSAPGDLAGQRVTHRRRSLFSPALRRQ